MRLQAIERQARPLQLDLDFGVTAHLHLVLRSHRQHQRGNRMADSLSLK